MSSLPVPPSLPSEPHILGHLGTSGMGANVMFVMMVLWVYGLISAGVAVSDPGRRLHASAAGLGAWMLSAILAGEPQSSTFLGVWALVAFVSDLDIRSFGPLWRMFGEKVREVAGGAAGALALLSVGIADSHLIDPLRFLIMSLPVAAFLLVDMPREAGRLPGTSGRFDLRGLPWHRIVVISLAIVAMGLEESFDMFFVLVFLVVNLVWLLSRDRFSDVVMAASGEEGDDSPGNIPPEVAQFFRDPTGAGSGTKPGNSAN